MLPPPGIQTGISYEQPAAGLVSEYEEREAARFNHYNWTQWQALPKRERIDGVAFYRTSRLVEMHQQDAVKRWSDAEAERNAALGGGGR